MALTGGRHPLDGAYEVGSNCRVIAQGKPGRRDRVRGDPRVATSLSHAAAERAEVDRDTRAGNGAIAGARGGRGTT